MPLFIIASNVTKGKPSILSKNVPLMDAIKCSCCLPGIFKPQILYDQIYVDGDFFAPNLAGVIPITETTLILTLPRPRSLNITATTIENISAIDFAFDLISVAVKQSGTPKSNECTIKLIYPELTATSELELMNIENIFEHSSKKLRRFLLAKNLS